MLIWAPLNLTQIQIQAQVVLLGTDAGKPQEDSREVGQGKEGSQQLVHCRYYSVHCGTLDFTCKRGLCQTKQALILYQLESKGAGRGTHQVLIRHQWRELTL